MWHLKSSESKALLQKSPLLLCESGPPGYHLASFFRNLQQRWFATTGATGQFKALRRIPCCYRYWYRSRVPLEFGRIFVTISAMYSSWMMLKVRTRTCTFMTHLCSRCRWRTGLSSPSGASLGNLAAQGFAANTGEAAETFCRAAEPGELWLQSCWTCFF